MKLSNLLAPLAGQVLSFHRHPHHGDDDPDIESIHYDSRTVTAGGLFVAMAGLQTDGHMYIDDAIKRGATAVIVDQPTVAPVATAVVANSRKALATLAAHFYGHPSKEMVVVGITGTNGKTTTSYLIEKMLSSAGFRVGAIGTINYRYGTTAKDAPVTTPEALDLQRILREMRDHGVTHVVMEVSSHALALNRIDGCELDVAVFTNLSQDHLDFHHDMIGYWDVKKRLFTDILVTGSKRASARAVINCDDPRGEQLVPELSVNVVTVGRAEKNHVRPDEVTIGQDGIRGELHLLGSPKGGSTVKLKLRSPLAGAFNLENILCAAGACVALQVPVKAIRTGIEKTCSVPGRLQRIDNPASIYVYVDYAHTPDALKNALATLRQLAQGRLICIAGCGGDRDRAKRPIMGKIAMALSDLVILTSDNPRNEPPMAIIEDMQDGINNGFRQYSVDHLPDFSDRPGYMIEPDRKKAIDLGIHLADTGDTVLIAGKGPETYQIIEGLRIPFDDSEVAAEALSQKPAIGGNQETSIDQCA